jgi:hypothetical protein
VKTTNRSLLQRLEALGFSHEETGGGCDCYSKQIGNGFSLSITDGEGNAPEHCGEPASLYLFCEKHSEPMAMSEHLCFYNLLAFLEVSL